MIDKKEQYNSKEVFTEEQIRFINKQISGGLKEMTDLILKEFTSLSELIEEIYFKATFCTEMLNTNPEVKKMYDDLKEKQDDLLGKMRDSKKASEGEDATV